ncbi:MAG TPA: carbohydrate binding domain-containing protein, partial [Prolixibacteraceae bacterium]|nr:carbohydrate binding domain-containing protein [Prolixibacteraceae bacterium]
MKGYFFLPFISSLFAATLLMAQPRELLIQVDKQGAEIQPTMYGLFFEDINYAADGGLYAELVKNRSFEFPQSFTGWCTFGKVELRDDGPFERNPHYVRLSWPGHDHKHTGLENEGFFGIGIEKEEKYRFSVWARSPEGTRDTLRVELVDRASMQEQQAFAAAALVVDSKEWKKYQVILTSRERIPKARLRIFLNSRGPVDMEHISLFPTDTWKGHENGLRKDLAQALTDIRPGVFRFPGG